MSPGQPTAFRRSQRLPASSRMIARLGQPNPGGQGDVSITDERRNAPEQPTENPFNADAGAKPTVFRGRDRELAMVDGAVRKALARRSGADIFFVGPRGNGKTALLNEIKGRTEDTKVLVVSGDDGTSPEAMARTLVEHTSENASFRSRVRKVVTPSAFDAGMKGANLKWGAGSNAPPASIRAVLKRACVRRPLILCVDEAHVATPETLSTLLNASQHLRATDKLQFLMILAGTPGLDQALSASPATFNDKGDFVLVGRLQSDGARAIFEDTMTTAGKFFEPDILQRTLTEAQNYSYFVQLLGEHLYDASANNARIDAQAFSTAMPGFRADQAVFYTRRYNEIERAGLRKPAVALAMAIAKAPNGRLPFESALQAMSCVSPAEADQSALLTGLAKVSFVWQPTDTPYELGIPSLGAFVVERSPSLARQVRGAVESLGVERFD